MTLNWAQDQTSLYEWIYFGKQRADFYSFIHPSICPSIHPFVHSFIHSFIFLLHADLQVTRAYKSSQTRGYFIKFYI